jgi:phosphoribosylformylglycinamidine synthase
MEPYWEVEVAWTDRWADPRAEAIRRLAVDRLREAGGGDRLEAISVADVYYLQGEGLSGTVIDRVSASLLSDPVTQVHRARLVEAGPEPSPPDSPGGPAGRAEPGDVATVLKKPGVMDPVEASLLEGLADLDVRGVRVRTATRFRFRGRLGEEACRLLAEKVLSNPAIEEVRWDGSDGDGCAADRRSPFAGAAPYELRYLEVPLEGLADEDLLRVSREGQLSLDLAEMRAVRDHFVRLGRAPSDVELETVAQTWSEHCSHKTFTSEIEHTVREGGAERTERIDNLLRHTIRRATEAIAAPWCLSVFADNAGVIAFDGEHAVTFKVETHNHPSAIEPYGGAGTGIGGVLRDTLGTGLGAKPIVNTDVFCFAPPDLPAELVPPGALHPLRTLHGVVAGVRDYGNRMGIPTASGAVYFDPRYAGNPLVFCGSVGFIPREAIEKRVEPGDRIYLLGGRTGRDGIHGATFSSVELTEESERVSSGAVQIGNAITEKKLHDLVLAARDRRLFRSITDCGAGGLSSAVGEMGASTGAEVELSRVPLKYEGLSYAEIWISEAQERMVVAVPPDRAAELEALARSEEVESTDIGEFTATGRLVLAYEGRRVADLDMRFLHGGRPRAVRRSVHERRPSRPASRTVASSPGKALHAVLASPNVASKEWIIRQYDHEVQGGSVLKPLQGARQDGPGDGVAFAPKAGSRRGVVIGSGMNPLYGDLDPYRMALSAVDEAVRNVTAAGGDPEHTAILDNFSWGNTDRPEVLGSLVEAARGCHDAAVALGTPFISGKDSLRNEYRAGGEVISIPPTLLVSAVSVVEDVRRLVSMDLKGPGLDRGGQPGLDRGGQPGNRLILVGLTREELGGSHYLHVLGGTGGELPGLDLARGALVHRAVHRVISRGLALACHDLSEGGLGVAAAEMAFAGGVGAEIRLGAVPREGSLPDEAILFSESNGRYLIEARPGDAAEVLTILEGMGVPAAEIGETVSYGILRVLGLDGRTVLAESLEDLKASWKRPLDLDVPVDAALAPGSSGR